MAGGGERVQVVFQHVPREDNAVADWLARYARHTRRSAHVADLLPGFRLGDSVPPDPEASPYVEVCCPKCGALHVDQGDFAVRPHMRHTCA